MKAQLQEDIKTAMKAREQKRLTVLRGLMSEFKNYEINNKKELTDELCVSLVQKEIKKRRDAIEFAEKAGRTELIDDNKAEVEILQSYLGAQLSEDELRNIISGFISDGADSIGAVMGKLNQAHKGSFEGKVASSIVKELLG